MLLGHTGQETTIILATEYVNIPESNLPQPGQQARSMTVIDTSMGEVNPLAISPEKAAEIGAQYIYDIFGVCISGMYVEVEYMAFTTRTFLREKYLVITEIPLREEPRTQN